MSNFLIEWAWSRVRDNPTAFNLAVAIKASLYLPDSSKQSTADIFTESAHDVQIVKAVNNSAAIIQFAARK